MRVSSARVGFAPPAPRQRLFFKIDIVVSPFIQRFSDRPVEEIGHLSVNTAAARRRSREGRSGLQWRQTKPATQTFGN